MFLFYFILTSCLVHNTVSLISFGISEKLQEMHADADGYPRVGGGV